MISFLCKSPIPGAALVKALPLTAAMLLTSCATNPVVPVVIASEVTDTASLVGDAAIGDVVRLPAANNQLGTSQVIVASQYTAASGKQCRRLTTVDARALPRVVCQSLSGTWTVGRQLQLPATATTTMARTQMPVSSRVVASAVIVPSVDPAADSVSLLELESDSQQDLQASNSSSNVIQNLQSDTVERSIDANETLWTFARRTTGNALNWQQIAILNNISNPELITSGQTLLIPATLVRDAN